MSEPGNEIVNELNKNLISNTGSSETVLGSNDNTNTITEKNTQPNPTNEVKATDDEQKKPEWDCIYSNFPKEADPDFNKSGGYKKTTLTEMKADGVYKIIGGEMEKLHKSGNKNYAQSCALKLSIALIKCGFTLPKREGMNNEGKGVILSVKDMIAYLSRKDILRESTVHLDASKQKLDRTTIWNSFSQKRGILIFVPKDPSRFGATGHVTIYSYSKYVNQEFVPHMYLDDPMQHVYFWSF